jgi:hypothetical protein
MSPVEHSRKHRQRTGLRKKGAGMFLPVIPVFSAENTHSDLQLAKTAMSPAEHSRKHRQRTGPRKKGAGMFLPVIPVRYAVNFSSDLQYASTAMPPAEYSRKHRQWSAKVKRRVQEFSQENFLRNMRATANKTTHARTLKRADV